jgi:hypothetical protein
MALKKGIEPHRTVVTGDLKVPWNGRRENVCLSSLVFFQSIRIKSSSVFFPRFLPFPSSS